MTNHYFELNADEKLLFQFKPGWNNTGYHLYIVFNLLIFLVPLGVVFTLLINQFFISMPVFFDVFRVVIKVIPESLQKGSALHQIGIGVGIIGLGVLAIGYLWAICLLYTRTFTFTDKRCIVVRALLSMDKHIIYYNRLSDINMSQTIIERLFNTATITLAELSYNQASGPGNLIPINGCTSKEAEQIVELVSQYISKTMA